MKNQKKKFKEKKAIQKYKDQLDDAWFLIEKKKKLKRDELFIKFDDTKKKN